MKSDPDVCSESVQITPELFGIEPELQEWIVERELLGAMLQVVLYVFAEATANDSVPETLQVLRPRTLGRVTQYHQNLGARHLVGDPYGCRLRPQIAHARLSQGRFVVSVSEQMQVILPVLNSLVSGYK